MKVFVFIVSGTMENSISTLHTLHDGSILRVIGAKELIKIPVWHGNRIIDNSHVERIKGSLGSNVQKLDFGYRIVSFTEIDAGGNRIHTSCVIDGQHRHRVLCDHFSAGLCEPDFPVIVLEKKVTCESEIITYFKELNNQMPILWKTDPKMMANGYIAALEKAFNTKKEILVRQKSTTRPYLSAEKMREELIKCYDLMKESKEAIQLFVDRAIQYNIRAWENHELTILHAKKGQGEIIQKAANHKFMLAVDPRLPWIRECLKG